jgi:hypothetical protein
MPIDVNAWVNREGAKTAKWETRSAQSGQIDSFFALFVLINFLVIPRTVKWMAERLQMGGPGYVNHLLYRRRKAGRK